MTNSVQQRWSLLQLPDQWLVSKIVTELHMSRLCLQKAAALCMSAGVFRCRAEGMVMSERQLAMFVNPEPEIMDRVYKLKKCNLSCNK